MRRLKSFLQLEATFQRHYNYPNNSPHRQQGFLPRILSTHKRYLPMVLQVIRLTQIVQGVLLALQLKVRGIAMSLIWKFSRTCRKRRNLIPRRDLIVFWVLVGSIFSCDYWMSTQRLVFKRRKHWRIIGLSISQRNPLILLRRSRVS